MLYSKSYHCEVPESGRGESLNCSAGSRGGGDPMEVPERSQSSQEEEGEGDDDIVGRMEIDDAEDMAEVADILLRLNVSKTFPCHRSYIIYSGWYAAQFRLQLVDFGRANSSHL